jgi:predicted membrane channel-forming protein YqfA (hemolysin III family)
MITYMPPGCVALVVAIGSCYMLGVAFVMFGGGGGFFHAVWHVLVMAASACTYAGVALYVVPK